MNAGLEAGQRHYHPTCLNSANLLSGIQLACRRFTGRAQEGAKVTDVNPRLTYGDPIVQAPKPMARDPVAA